MLIAMLYVDASTHGYMTITAIAAAVTAVVATAVVAVARAAGT